MSSNLPRRLALAFCSLALVACPTDEGDTEETGQTETSGTEGGLDDGICELEDPFACECFMWEAQWLPGGIVYGTYVAAVSACINECNEMYGDDPDDTKLTPINCSEVPPLTDCSDWPPARTIKLEQESGVYVVDRALVDQLMLDPSPLRTCDDAVLVPLMSGGCLLTGADSDGLAHLLGLRDDDVLLSLNDYALDSAVDLVVGFTKLWSKGATVFELELRRDGRLYTLRYRVTGA